MEAGFLKVKFLRQAAVVIGSGGLIFGYDIGIIAGTLDQLTDEFNLSDFEEGLVVSILYGGSLLGCLIGFVLCDKIGRKKTIHIQNFIFVLGAIVTAGATNLSSLCTGRFIVGIASALSGICDVPYLLEVSPVEYRGELTSMYEILVSVGVVISFMMGLLLLSLPDVGWRVAFAIPCLAAILQSIGMYLVMPESPKWLLEMGRISEATNILVLIYGSADVFPPDIIDALDTARKASALSAASSSHSNTHSVEGSSSVLSPMAAAAAVSMKFDPTTDRAISNLDDELFNPSIDSPEKRLSSSLLSPMAAAAAVSMKSFPPTDESSDANEQLSPYSPSSDSQTSSYGSTKSLFDLGPETTLLKRFMYPLYLVAAFQVLAQITGGVVIRNYSPTIFQNNGISRTESLIFNVVLGIVKLFFTVLSVSVIEDSGRLMLAQYGAALVGFGMLFLTVASAASNGGNLNSPAIFLIGASLCLGGYGVGYAPISWVFSAEMFPTPVRGSVMAISLLVSNLAQLFTNLIFLPATDVFTAGGVFAFFLVMNVGSVFFIRGFFVETKQKDPYQILQSLETRRNDTMRRLCCCGDTFSKCPSEENTAEDKSTVELSGHTLSQIPVEDISR